MRGHVVRLAVLVIAASELFAQTNVGAIFGHVGDQTGGAIQGATVTLLNPATNEKIAILTNDRGDYLFNSVRPATYSVSAGSAGFKTAVREQIILQVAEKISVDFTLVPGEITQKVEVHAEAPLLQPGSSDIGTAVNTRTILDLPLEGRNVYQLVALVPGTTPNESYGYASGGSSNLSGGPGIGLNQISINGGRNLLNDFLLDDVPNTTMGYNGVAIIPPLDAVQEFNVITNSPGARFGRTGGGLTTAVTKSGTNELHGDIWEFLRNDKLDANNFFANSSGAAKPPFRQNQFGGTAGGPIIRNRTFIFGAYEGLRQATGGQLFLTVPTDLQRKGDFSQTFRGEGSLFQVFDPFTTTQKADGSFTRQQFPGNVIPVTRYDPVSNNLLSYFPEPNLLGDPTTHANNFLSQAGFHNLTDLYLFRVDHNITDKQRIFARISYDRQTFQGGNVLGNAADFNSDPFSNHHKGLTLSYTNLLNNSTVLNVRYGLLREEQVNNSHSAGFDPSSLGLPAAAVNQFEAKMFPRFDIAGYTSLGTQYFTLVDRANTTNSLAANLSKVIGKHSIEAGIDLRLIQGALFQAGWPSGQFAFDPGFTNGPDPFGGAGNGNGFASFLLGTYGAGFASYDPHWLFSQHYYAFYVQDDIKLSRNLTFNVGLRWDYESPLADRYNQLSFVDLNADVPLKGVTPVDVGLGLGLKPQPPFKGAVGFPGVNGAGKGVSLPLHNDWGPRFGLAFALTNKTVIRTAFGILYPGTTADNSGNYPTIQGFNPITSPVDSADGITPFNNPDRSGLLSNPFPNGLRQMLGSKLGPLTSVGDSNVGFLRNDKHPYMEQWNFGLQRELPGNLLVEAAYVGAHGVHLEDFAGAQFNVLPDQYLSLGNALFDSLPNPFYGILPATSAIGASNTITRKQLLLPYPYFGSIAGQAGHIASSIYNGLQLKAQKRMSKGLSALFSYTFSKAIDDASRTEGGQGGAGGHQDFNDRRLDRSISSYDRSQVANVSFIYELPFGQGRALGGSISTPVLKQLISGWQVDAIFTAAKGIPLLIGCSVCVFPATRPDLIGDANKGMSGSAQSRLNKWFNTDAFAVNKPFQYGNVSRTMPSTRGPGQANTNFSVIKDTTFLERYKLQFRAEFFNLFNRVEFGTPDTNFGDSTFGVISSQVNIPRQIQFGMKFYW
jgi:hypothetical protein